MIRVSHVGMVTIVAASLTAFASSGFAQGAPFPNKTVRIVVGAPPSREAKRA